MPTRSAADDQTDPACWHGGFLYFNPNDPAIAVPRRDGFGYTPECRATRSLGSDACAGSSDFVRIPAM